MKSQLVKIREVTWRNTYENMINKSTTPVRTKIVDYTFNQRNIIQNIAGIIENDIQFLIYSK